MDMTFLENDVWTIFLKISKVVHDILDKKVEHKTELCVVEISFFLKFISFYA